MFIVLDRRLCAQKNDFCENCFSSHLRWENFNKSNCIVSIDLQDRAELVFNIFDRDDSFKRMVVKEENLDQALHSWFSLWEEQAGPII